MKYLRSILCLAVVAFITNSYLATADTNNSVRLLIAKSNQETAEIMIGSKTYLAPISFESGFDWTDVKDAYNVPPAYAALIEKGRISIYLGCSGMEFHVLPHTPLLKKRT